jgi:hypothetical protein
MGSNDCVAVAQMRSLTVLDPTRTAAMVANARSSATKATFAMMIDTLVIVIDIVVVFVLWSKPALYSEKIENERTPSNSSRVRLRSHLSDTYI